MPGKRWDQSLDAFLEGRHVADYSSLDHFGGTDWSRAAMIDWTQMGLDYAAGRGREVSAYLSAFNSPNFIEAVQTWKKSATLIF